MLMAETAKKTAGTRQFGKTQLRRSRNLRRAQFDGALQCLRPATDDQDALPGHVAEPDPMADASVYPLQRGSNAKGIVRRRRHRPLFHDADN